MSEANGNIAMACTLSFVDESMKFIESKIHEAQFSTDTEIQAQYQELVYMAPQLVVISKEALAHPEDSDR